MDLYNQWNSHHFSEATDSPLPSPEGRHIACPQDWAKSLWKSLYKWVLHPLNNSYYDGVIDIPIVIYACLLGAVLI